MLVMGIATALSFMGLGIIVSHVIVLFCGRYRQAGRKGYGFEKRGLDRVKTAFRLFVTHELRWDWYDD